MNQFKIKYFDSNKAESFLTVRAENAPSAVAYFESKTPFLVEAIEDMGEDIDNGKPPVIGPP